MAYVIYLCSQVYTSNSQDQLSEIETELYTCHIGEFRVRSSPRTSPMQVVSHLTITRLIIAFVAQY